MTKKINNRNPTTLEEPTMLDKAIAYFSPAKAAKREWAKRQLNILNSGYSHHGANENKKATKGWDSESGSPNEDINDNLALLRERSRDLYMGGANIATGAIKTTRTNAIGSGLVLKPSIDNDFLKMTDEEAESWKQAVVREFEYFSNSVNCDRFRLNNFYELQQLAFLSMLLSGDVFVLLPYKKRQGFMYDLRIQLIEGDRVKTPESMTGNDNVNNGVETAGGEVSAYYIMNSFPGSANDDDSYTKVLTFGNVTGRRNILHLMESERPDQTRGLPVLAPVIESLRQLGRYTVAELTAAVVGGLFTVFVYEEFPQLDLGDSMDVEEQIDPDNPFTYELGNGSVVRMRRGEKIETATPGRPNVAFDGFVNAILRQIGSSLEIPYELLIKHFSASYSASRAALLEAWKMFRMRRKWFANDFCQPIYEEWLSEAVAKGRIYAPGFFDDPIIRAAYCKAEWHGPSQGQIDPLREATAAIRRIEAELSTREREAAEMTGTDFNVNHRQRVKEETMRQELRRLEEGEI
ncbi:MAG: phage portal protein [Oscillospiraceae bacterium]|nr:phage portal protein [Oscillospiraceae bacterium]